MIKISRISKKENDKFGNPKWDKLDIFYYGQEIEWTEKKFRFKAVEDGKILGTVSGKYESSVVYVGNIIVAEEYRGKGIGKILMEKVEEVAKKMKAHKIWLITGSDWPTGKFYESLGYKIEAHFPNHHFHKDFVVYSKFI